jgi:hypothetical protein
MSQINQKFIGERQGSDKQIQDLMKLKKSALQSRELQGYLLDKSSVGGQSSYFLARSGLHQGTLLSKNVSQGFLRNRGNESSAEIKPARLGESIMPSSSNTEAKLRFAK